MIVSVWGKENRMEELRSLIKKEHICIPFDELINFDLSKLDALILPMQSVQGNKGDYMDRQHIDLPNYFWECLREDCRIFAGRETRFLETLQQPKFYYLQDEQFIDENAKLTAQGTLFYFLDQIDRAMEEYQVDIIGKGHCGKAIGCLLQKCGVHLRYIRHDHCIGNDECLIDHWLPQYCAPFVIQCSPVHVLNESLIKKWPPHVHVIDISGSEKQYEDMLTEHRILYTRAANLPELFAPKSSAKAIFNFVRRMWNE